MRFLLSLLGVGLLTAQKSELILVKLRPSPDLNADNALHPSFEEKRVTLKFKSPDWDDPLEEEDDTDNPPISECFVPQLKLITENFTYVISLGCGNLIAYQNSKPFTTSDRRVQSPLEFTDEMRYFLEKACEKYMKILPKRLYVEYKLSYVPSVSDAVKYEDLDLLLSSAQVLDDDKDDDEQIEIPPDRPSDFMASDDEEDDDEEEDGRDKKKASRK
ncbi:MAG: hypothetical protein NZ580_00890 [Bacteroidia bacterium]|nr:hypothetical protein [Bacteroidia bacterium]MDW8235251.1 hypothetical protein [Bacteroidia bacterium]